MPSKSKNPALVTVGILPLFLFFCIYPSYLQAAETPTIQNPSQPNPAVSELSRTNASLEQEVQDLKKRIEKRKTQKTTSASAVPAKEKETVVQQPAAPKEVVVKKETSTEVKPQLKKIPAASQKTQKVKQKAKSSEPGFFAKLFGAGKTSKKAAPKAPVSQDVEKKKKMEAALQEARLKETVHTEKKVAPPVAEPPKKTPSKSLQKEDSGPVQKLFAAPLDVLPTNSRIPQLRLPSQETQELPKPEFLTLDECVERSVIVSVPKEVAQKRLSFNRWTLTKAIRDLFPEVAFKFNGESGSLSGTKYRDRDWNFELKQPLFRGFTLVNTVLQENYNRKASKAEIQKTIQEAIFNAFSSYFTLNRAELMYQNHVEAVKEYDRLLQQTEEKKKRGLVSEIEYLGVQSKYADSLEAKELMWSDREIAALELKKVLYLPPQEQIDIAPLYDYDSYRPDKIDVFGKKAGQEADKLKMPEARTLDDFIILAYKNRPDLKMEQSKLMANRYAEKAAKGGWLPQSDMVMKLGQVRQGYIGSYPGGDYPPFDFNRDYSLGIVTSWNMGGNTVKHEYNNVQAARSVTQFQGAEGSTKIANTFTAQLLDGLKQYADVRQAQVQVLEQLNVYDETERAAIKEVVEAFYKYRAALIKLQSASAGLNYYKRSLDLAKLRMDKNEIQASEYMDSFKDLVERRDQFHNAMGDYFLSKAQLNHAVGIKDFIPFDELIDAKNQNRS